MLKNFFIISILCLSITSLYAGIANGGACNPNGLTSTSNAADIAIQDASCTSGLCGLEAKKCKDKNALGLTCNRNANCAEGTCFNSKCLLPANSYCTVATNCSSGVCTSNKCT